MIDLLLTPVFAAHLLLVNIASAGPLVCVWLEWRETNRSDKLARHTGRRLARDSTWSLGVAMLIGALLVGVLWLRGDTTYFRAVAVVPPSRLWFALAEALVSLALLAIYAAGWNWFKKRRVWHRLLAILAATNLLYHFPPLFALLSTLADRPALLAEPMDKTAFKKLLLDPEILSRVAHVWLASFAVVGALLLFYALHAARQEPANSAGIKPQSARVAAWGAWLALAPSVLQLLVGMWVLLQMPDARRNLLLGDNWLITGIFAASVLSALRLMHQLAAVALGDSRPKQLVGSVGAMIATVVLMTAVLQLTARQQTVAPALSQLTLSPHVRHIE